MKSKIHEYLKNNFKLMSKNILSLLVVTTLLFTSCKKEETTESAPPEEATTDATAIATDSLATANTASVPQTGADANSVMYNQPTTGSTVTAVPTPQPTQTVAKGMNPAHGQPGHRCDIEVGMPLNSPPGKKAANNIQPTVTQATTVTPAMINQANGPTTAAPANQVVTAPGMNPPHGQEGHVCGTPVGEPLPKK
jgi:hypothetical protein